MFLIILKKRQVGLIYLFSGYSRDLPSAERRYLKSVGFMYITVPSYFLEAILPSAQ